MIPWGLGPTMICLQLADPLPHYIFLPRFPPASLDCITLAVWSTKFNLRTSVASADYFFCPQMTQMFADKQKAGKDFRRLNCYEKWSLGMMK